MDKITGELGNTVRLPGLANLWMPPIRNHIDMLPIGIKSPIGIKVSGTMLVDIDAMAEQIEKVARTVPGVASTLAERLEDRRYINVEINRKKAACYGMTVADVQLFMTSTVGGVMADEAVGGIICYPISLRYPQSQCDSPQALHQLLILTPMKQRIILADMADVRVSTGPSMLKTKDARPMSWIHIGARGRDIVPVVHNLQKAITEKVQLKPGTNVTFSGQFELLGRANHKLRLMVSMTLVVIFVLLYLAFRRVD